MISWLEQHLSPCFFKSGFGIECPGCGMQRSLIALLKGEFFQSLQCHAALIPFLLTILMLVIQLKMRYENGGKWIMWAFIITTAITVIQFIIRQIILFT